MSFKLAQLLTQNEIVSDDDMDIIFSQRQEDEGRGLTFDTSVCVKSDLSPLELLDFLAEALGLAPVAMEQLHEVSAETLARVSSEQVAELEVFPLGTKEDSLWLASPLPLRRSKMGKVKEALGEDVVFSPLPQLLFTSLLQTHYDLTPKDELLSLLERWELSSLFSPVASEEEEVVEESVEPVVSEESEEETAEETDEVVEETTEEVSEETEDTSEEEQLEETAEAAEEPEVNEGDDLLSELDELMGDSSETEESAEDKAVVSDEPPTVSFEEIEAFDEDEIPELESSSSTNEVAEETAEEPVVEAVEEPVAVAEEEATFEPVEAVEEAAPEPVLETTVEAVEEAAETTTEETTDEVVEPVAEEEERAEGEVSHALENLEKVQPVRASASLEREEIRNFSLEEALKLAQQHVPRLSSLIPKGEETAETAPLEAGSQTDLLGAYELPEEEAAEETPETPTQEAQPAALDDFLAESSAEDAETASVASEGEDETSAEEDSVTLEDSVEEEATTEEVDEPEADASPVEEAVVEPVAGEEAEEEVDVAAVASEETEASVEEDEPAPGIPSPAFTRSSVPVDELDLDSVPRLSYEEAMNLLGALKTRDAVLEIGLYYVASVCDVAAVLIRKKTEVAGRYIIGDMELRERFREWSVSMDDNSIFGSLQNAMAPFSGPAPHKDSDLSLYKVLGGEPEQVYIFPIRLGRMVVAFLYGHEEKEPLSEEDFGHVLQFSNELGTALGQVILYRKQGITEEDEAIASLLESLRSQNRAEYEEQYNVMFPAPEPAEEPVDSMDDMAPISIPDLQPASEPAPSEEAPVVLLEPKARRTPKMKQTMQYGAWSAQDITQEIRRLRSSESLVVPNYEDAEAEEAAEEQIATEQAQAASSDVVSATMPSSALDADADDSVQIDVAEFLQGFTLEEPPLPMPPTEEEWLISEGRSPALSGLDELNLPSAGVDDLMLDELFSDESLQVVSSTRQDPALEELLSKDVEPIRLDGPLPLDLSSTTSTEESAKEDAVGEPVPVMLDLEGELFSDSDGLDVLPTAPQKAPPTPQAEEEVETPEEPQEEPQEEEVLLSKPSSGPVAQPKATGSAADWMSDPFFGEDKELAQDLFGDGEAPLPLGEAQRKSSPSQSPEAISAPSVEVVSYDDGWNGKFVISPLTFEDIIEEHMPDLDPLPGSDKSAEVMLPMLENDSAEVRKIALESLKELPKEKVVPTILEQLFHVVSREHINRRGEIKPMYEDSYPGLMWNLALEYPEETLYCLVPNLYDFSEQTRMMTLLMMQQLPYESVLPHLFRMLREPEPSVVFLSRKLIRDVYKTSACFEILRTLRNKLQAHDVVLLSKAVRLLVILRDEVSVPQLIELLGEKNKQVVQTASMALSEITKQQLGTSYRKWSKWWKKVGSQTKRIDWLIEGLQIKNIDVMQSSIDELVDLTGQDLDFDPYAGRRERNAAVQLWKEWRKRHR